MLKLNQIIKKDLNIIFELVKRDLKKKYRGSFLGIIWSVLNPLLMMTVLTLVFSNVFRFDTKNYPLYLMTGQVLFNFFSESTSVSMLSIISNASLIKKIYFKKWLLPFSSVSFSWINTFFSIIAIFIIVIFTGEKIHLSYILIPLLLFYLFLFALGFGMILSATVVFFRDIMYLYSVFLTILMYLTPIFYPEKIIPEQYKFIVSLNPLVYFLKYFRQIILDGVFPDLKLNLICIFFGVSSLIIGILVFKSRENEFVLDI